MFCKLKNGVSFLKMMYYYNIKELLYCNGQTILKHKTLTNPTLTSLYVL